ncbi:hypothetical protein GM415_06645 [Pseudodesulfovibrio cashew]|uniref:Uncharacterized protein n=1 Tax=Pseudodesulfovibrio cashew TaxID=2678688 RepID=A0A6I6JHH9_9BACT|nr:hypothetical protein [Pseudodesulfovibrio cashew]QGY39812.1 hypothetical protein GM415_06645 [Pseudodesulfovibrio cashew]
MSEATRNEDTILGIFLLGLRTWLAEIKWLSKSALTRFEVSRLEKELNQEYGNLGRIAEAPRGKMAEKELCLKQIGFLKEEIENLRADLAADRETRMATLRENN